MLWKLLLLLFVGFNFCSNVSSLHSKRQIKTSGLFGGSFNSLCEPPSSPKSGSIRCSSNTRTMMCNATCLPGFKFPDGSSKKEHSCSNYDGIWKPAMRFQDCEPICDPPCQNGGHCFGNNRCVCAPGFRGDLCQYPISNCDGGLFFTVSWACNHTMTETLCTVSCPMGLQFQYPPASVYRCNVHGEWHPKIVPNCHSVDFFEHPTVNPIAEPIVITNDKMKIAYSVVNSGRKNRICSTWNQLHYRTFGGSMFSFQGKCTYLLARDCVSNTFNIRVTNDPLCNGVHKCQRQVIIEANNRRYIMDNSENGPKVFLDNKILKIPSTINGLVVEKIGHYVVLESGLGFKVGWNGDAGIFVEVQNAMQNNTCGLCGRIDDSGLVRDLELKDGSITTNIVNFANSWKINDMGDYCPDINSFNHHCKYDSSHNQAISDKAHEVCKKLFNVEYSACHDVLDVQPYFEMCQMDFCGSEETDNQNSICSTFAAYFQECNRLGGKLLSNWRKPDFCAVECPQGLIYNDCGSSCPPTCRKGVQECSSDSCVEGCFCPVGSVLHEDKCIKKDQCPCFFNGKPYSNGQTIFQDCNACICEKNRWECTKEKCGGRCSVIGDAHYTTFDGRQYDFTGMCSYYLVFNKGYSIEQETIACSGSISDKIGFVKSPNNKYPACTKSIVIRIRDTVIHLKQRLEITANGKEILELPFFAPGIYVYSASSIYIKAELENGITILWDGISRVYIDAPSSLLDKTSGLCGTFNHNQKDDYLTIDGDIEQDVSAFADKWKTSETCIDVSLSHLSQDSCELYSNRKEQAKKYCDKLKSNAFSSCHDVLDFESFYRNCIYDVCHCQADAEDCYCPVLADYGVKCNKQKPSVNWRKEIQECGISCPGDQEYQVCGSSCKRSCTDISYHTKCREECVEGCNCPTGTTLNRYGDCIPIVECPCVHGEKVFQPGYLDIRGNMTCECKNALWSCRPATQQELSRSHNKNLVLEPLCNDADNMEYTDCSSELCIKTCKNMHSPPSCNNQICKPGCTCKKDYVLDTISGRCIAIAECPCHHGGQSYGEGDQIKEECNTCTCKSGKWDCEKKECPEICESWGSSHFKTFDGRMYEFHGDCDYVLTRGGEEAFERFSIVIRNVLCGTSDITCSKAVVFQIADEKVTLNSDRPLTQMIYGSRFAVREVGLYIFIHTDIGITLQWDKGTRVYVRAAIKWKNKVEGLCGNFDDDESNDFGTPDGGIAVVKPTTFGDSWRVRDYCPTSKTVNNTCETHPQRKGWALKQCGILKSNLFQRCHSEVPVDSYVERCIFDTCGCDMGGDCECLCTAIAAYAQECSNNGIVIKWRTQSLCPIQCEDCAEYSGCISVCPKPTCETEFLYDGVEHLCENEACVEGCEPKPCPPGHRYNNPKEWKCIPESDCLKLKICKVINGVEHYEGQRITDSEHADPCQSCFCRGGKIICIGKPCASSSTPSPTNISVVTETTTKPTTTPIPICDKTGWTEWMNSFTPNLMNGGDYETIDNLRKKQYRFCPFENIREIECRTAITHKNYTKTGQKVWCSLPDGLACSNKEQSAPNMCLDYEVRIDCHCGPATTPPVSCPMPLGMESKSIEDQHISVSSYQSLNTLGNHGRLHGWHSWKAGSVIQPQWIQVDLGQVKEVSGIITQGHPQDNEWVTFYKLFESKDGENWNQFINGEVDEFTGNIDHSSPVTNLLDPVNTRFIRLEPINWNNWISLRMEIMGCGIETTTIVEEITITTEAPTTTSTPSSCASNSDGWTEWMSSTNPNENLIGDDETFQSLRSKYNFCSDNMIKDIQCNIVRTTIPYNKAGQAGIVCDINLGLQCLHKLQKSGSCLDFEVRFYCPCTETETAIVPVPPSASSNVTSYSTLEEVTPSFEEMFIPNMVCEEWSSWINMDTPLDDGIDSELFRRIPNFKKKCPIPLEYECRDANTWQRHDHTGQQFKERCGPHGIVCESSEKQKCSDYEMRVYCSCKKPPPCIHGWTKWFDIDDPYIGEGDFEHIEEIRLKNDVCSQESVFDVQCEARSLSVSSKLKAPAFGKVGAKTYGKTSGSKTSGSKTFGSKTSGKFGGSPLKMGASAWVDFTETGDVGVKCTTSSGLSCYNALQSHNKKCKDYRIRFFCNCESTTVLPPIEEPSTTTQPPIVVTEKPGCGWSSWFNHYSPERGDSSIGDFELIDNLEMCQQENIKAIECQTVDSKIPWTTSGQDGLVCDVKAGFLCDNRLQNHGCYDYEVRVCCSTETSTESTTTEITEITTITMTPPCIPGMMWSDCAYSCENMCHSFVSKNQINDLCNDPKQCIPGCIDKECAPPSVWRDEKTCVKPQECTCNTEDGKLLSPGQVVKVSDCEYCQCIDNKLHCNRSCVTPSPPSTQCPPGFTKWFDLHTPNANGEIENHQSIVDAGLEICAADSLLAIECKVKGTNIQYFDSDDKGVSCNLMDGLICENDLQYKRNCSNYEIRFECDCLEEPVSSPTPPEITTPEFTTPSVTSGGCSPGFTKWFDLHKPNLNGETENYQAIVDAGLEICEVNLLKGIECAIKGTDIQYFDSDDKGVSCNLMDGLICENDLQYKRNCSNYEIRFECDCLEEPVNSPTPEITTPEFTTPSVTSGGCSPGFTKWFDLHKPNLNGETENYQAIVDAGLEICEVNLLKGIECAIKGTDIQYFDSDDKGVSCNLVDGLICENDLQYGRNCSDYQIKFNCDCGEVTTPSCNNYWSDWINEDKPLIGEGDIENLTNYPSFCKNGVIEAIECVVADDNLSHDEGPGKHLVCSVAKGFSCLNKYQPNKMCDDYKIRYLCGCGEPPPTPFLELCPETYEGARANCPLVCPSNQVCDGYNCVDKIHCSCYHDGKLSKPGDIIETSSCQECICKLNGISHCYNKTCPVCSYGIEGYFDEHCNCECKTCPKGEILCPRDVICLAESKWCDGKNDCQDDEIGCVTSTTTESAEANITTTPCPTQIKPVCKPDWKLLIQNPNEPCPQYTCAPPKITPPDSSQLTSYTCTMSSGIFNTFDGFEYNYEICDHVLVKDKVNNRFNITVHKDCSDNNKNCHRYLIVNQGKHKVKVENLKVEYDGRVYDGKQLARLSKNRPQLSMKHVGDVVLIKSEEFNFEVMWDITSNAKIDVYPDLKNRLEGLCGYFNSNPDDDKMTPNFEEVDSTTEFGDSWSIGSLEKCEPSTCPTHIMTEAEAACNQLRFSPFDVCNSVVDPTPFINICKASFCECMLQTNSTDKDCKCKAYLPYVEACEINNVIKIRYWRSKQSCLPNCPLGLVWQDCGSACERTCENMVELHEEDVCPDDHCVPGCFCPIGLVRKGDHCVKPEKCEDCVCKGYGDPHYFTYDGSYFPFQGNCTYVLSRDVIPEETPKAKHKFEVYATNEDCHEEPLTTCTVAIMILYNGHIAHFRVNESVTFDGVQLFPFDFPFHAYGIHIESIPGRSVTFTVIDIHLVVRYFELNYGFEIRLPSEVYYNKTEGLCGNCNFNNTDDFRCQDGKITNDTNEFGFSWIAKPPEGFESVDEICKLRANTTELTCKNSIELEMCDVILQDVFKPCHTLVNPEVYLASCRFDMCHSVNAQSSLCRTATEYARKCAEVGICINTWRTKDFCPYECPPGMQFQQCGSACPKSCKNIVVSDWERKGKDIAPQEYFSLEQTLTELVDVCDTTPVDGCFCHESKVFKDGQCVDPILCESCDDEGHKVGDTWQTDLCTSCVCTTKLTIECVRTHCPAPMICNDKEELKTIPANNKSCCNIYECVKKPKHHCPQTNELPTCKIGEVIKTRSNDETNCPEYYCECDIFQCPPLQTTVQLAVGEETHVVKKHCCPEMEIICNTAKCPEKPVCEKFQKLVEKQHSKFKCCPEFECEMPPNVCHYIHQFEVVNGRQRLYDYTEEPHENIYKPGEIWKDGLCRNCSCEFSNGQYKQKCVVEICASLNNYKDVKDYVWKTELLPNVCCPKFTRELCVHQGRNYSIGEEWDAEYDKCKHYYCDKLPTGEAIKVERFITCDKNCKNGFEYVEPPESSPDCCGKCKPVACIEDGQLHRIGSVWNSTSQKCFTGECFLSGEDTLQTRFNGPICPTIPSNCKTTVLDASGCCKTCTEYIKPDSQKVCRPEKITPSQTIKLLNITEFGIFCTNNNPIDDMTHCIGTCTSTSVFSTGKDDYVNSCTCCSPTKEKKKRINLDCSNGEKRQIEYLQPTECSCEATDCSAKPDFSNSEIYDMNQVAHSMFKRK